jgi:polyhydroxybutyrate depolymerase
VVQGVLVTKPCDPVVGVDLLQLHQKGDQMIRWGGTKASVLLSAGALPQVDRGFDSWMTAQRCKRPAVATEGQVTTTTASCRGKSVALLIAVEGGNGDWPAGPDVPIDATESVLGFFDLSPPA